MRIDLTFRLRLHRLNAPCFEKVIIAPSKVRPNISRSIDFCDFDATVFIVLVRSVFFSYGNAINI